MPLPDWLFEVSWWLYSAIVVACVLLALIRKRDTSAALAWSLAIVFLPFLGPFLFLTFGHNRISRRLRRKIVHRASFSEEHSVRTTLREHGRRPADAPSPRDRWGNLSQMLERLHQAPRRTGNRTELYSQSTRAFHEMERAIRAARHHIHIEFYIFRADEVGRHFAEILCERARAGVRVRLVLDGIGSFGGLRIKRQLKRAGVEVVSFLHPLHLTKLVSPNLRNHRKLVICDGRVAFFGGLNVGKEYLGRWRNRGRDWSDLHWRICGPAVWDLQWIFTEDWHYCTGTLIDEAESFPELPADGDQPAQVLSSGPDRQPSPVQQAIFAAVTRAVDRIEIATPYLVPDLAICDALALAAHSGVRVRIVTQHPPPDNWLAYLCGREFIAALDKAGVQVFGYTPGMMHAKGIVVDGEWSLVGTANLDNRSMFLNFELMVVLDDGPEPRRIEAAIADLVAASTRLDGDWLRRRPRWERILGPVARLLAPLL